MRNRHARVRWCVLAVAAVMTMAACSSSSSLSSEAEDDVADSASLSGGSSDPGSFVGRPSGAEADETAGDPGDDTDGDLGDDTDGDPENDTAEQAADPENAAPLGVPSKDPGLSTNPDVAYVEDTCFAIPAPAAAAVEVGCNEAHVIEIYAIRDLAGGPGAPFLGLADALALCDEEFTQITGIGIALATIYTRSVLRPSEETWADGERDVTCYVRYPEETDRLMTEINPVRDFDLVSIYGMEAGDCFIGFEDSETTFVPVACEQPHDAEVFIDFEFPLGDFPGDEVIDGRAQELCFGQSFEAFVGRDYESSSVFSLQSRPNAETWGLGDRTINCILSDEMVRTGSFEGTGL